ncbi:MAG: AraC family transcriptional regulator [Kiritimatiellia bacterium]|nr:AraC family transcriptional regulator [Kiritimatiellia bacterium]
MNKKKASKVDLGSPEVQRTGKYFLQFFKGTFYQKILTGNSVIQFFYGYFSFPKPYPIAFHEELELFYVRQGPGAYYLAGKIYPFQKRLLLITKPNDIHSVMSGPLKTKSENACLVFPLGWLGMDLDVKSWPHEILLSEEEAARLELIFGQVSEEVKNKGPGYEDMIRVKFQEICCLVRRIVSQPEKERANPLVDQLREYITQHFAEKTSILNISKGFGYTEQYLERLFKKSMGLSLKRYILQQRIMEARILLETKPELKLTAIAGQVGFEDYRLFHRIFKILTGVKPEAYRSVIKKTVAIN